MARIIFICGHYYFYTYRESIDFMIKFDEN